MNVAHPRIIQGGMGAGVSSWRLARAVSALGQLGVVSGTALDVILVRRLQDGDAGGHMRRAFDRFPCREMADRIWRSHFVEGGKAPGSPYRPIPMHSDRSGRELQELCVIANFTEICLAREGHDGPVGINYLEKIQLPHLPSIYGAMLAGVDYVLMGAGIPLRIPGVLERFVRHEPAAYPLHVAGDPPGEGAAACFDPRALMACDPAPLRRPRFLPIVASHALALTLARKSNGPVDGFVVEGPTAGGHNAPPRGGLRLDGAGEPIYGEKDEVDLARLRDLGLPFWIAGGTGSAEGLRKSLDAGGAGIQVGTAFAFCEESALDDGLKRRMLERIQAGTACVFTDPTASPTGFPFKVAQLAESLSEPDVYQARSRVCDLGYLREIYRKADGSLGYRCPGEPVDLYVAKGGRLEDTAGRKCLCNALVATIGHPQTRRDGAVEKPVVTSGNDLGRIARFLRPGRLSYTARDVIEAILGVSVDTRAVAPV